MAHRQQLTTHPPCALLAARLQMGAPAAVAGSQLGPALSSPLSHQPSAALLDVYVRPLEAGAEAAAVAAAALTSLALPITAASGATLLPAA